MRELIYILCLTTYIYHPIQTYSITSNDNNVTELLEYVLLDGEKHPCARTCTKNSPPMVCRYNFLMEWYQTMSKACYDCPFVGEDCDREHCIPGDGRKRPVLVVNRQMPGPAIEVCLGDEVVIDVENGLMGDSTTMHWHGHHQRGTPYMDGVPYVTQCPISPGTTFTYRFRALNPGTHFWHSHTGFQRADGTFGSFIVRTPEEIDPHYPLYDFDLSEHTLVILDWDGMAGINKFVAHHHSDGDNKPTSLLINGRGKFEAFNSENETLYTPYARFKVEQGYRYRFRVINAGFLNCPIQISVDNHNLTVISSDGNDFEATQVESVVTYAGERFDFILNADQPKDLYWMRFRGLMDCDERFTSVHQEAIIEYDGVVDELPSGPDPDYSQANRTGLQINPLNKGSGENESITMPELRSLDGWDESLKKEPDMKYYLEYDFYNIDNLHFHKPGVYGFNNVTDQKQRLKTPQLNHISLKLQPFPLLSQRDQINSEMFCNESTVTNCEQEHCECTHVVQVPLNAVVELILVDTGFAFDANHPFHLHGHSFRVVAIQKIGSNVTLEHVKKLDKAGLIHRNLENAPFKDTVTVPDGGFTILRFHATNPGYWMFHCHIEFHVEVGMALIFKVGDHAQMPPVPTDFPKCGNYYSASLAPTPPDPCQTNNLLVNALRKLLPQALDSTECLSSASSQRLAWAVLITVVLLAFVT